MRAKYPHFSLILILLAGALGANCYSSDEFYEPGSFEGGIIIEFSDNKKQAAFQLSLKDGKLKPSYEVDSTGKEVDVLKHCFKLSFGKDFQNKFEKYRSLKGETVRVLEQRLNKSNYSQLQMIVDKDFAFFRKYKLVSDFIDIHSKQDGTILKNFNPTLFHPNNQFTYAIYGLEQRVLIDLNRVSLSPLPHGLRVLDGEPCRDPAAWSGDGKYFVLKKEEDFIIDKSIKGEERISYKTRLLVLDAEKNQAIFGTEIDGIVSSVAWSPDLKSLAVVSQYYHNHTVWPWQRLPGKLRIARNHYTYNLELFHLYREKKQKFVLSQDRKLWAADDIIWTK